ncbi:MAG: PKD-like domain-containing protein [Alistipes sp.]
MKTFNLKTLSKALFVLGVTTAFMGGCSSDQTEELTTQRPTITFTNTTDIYVVKVGKVLTLEPTVENDHDAIYSWTTADGKLLGREKKFTYSWGEAGQVYLTFRVVTEQGTAQKEIRVDVATLVPPRISLAVPKDGYIILKGQPLELNPQVDNNASASYEWRVDTKIVATTQKYTFNSAIAGTFHVALATANEDGTDALEFDVKVMEPAAMPFAWLFEQEVYHVAKGRTIRLLPYGITNAFDGQYCWTVDGKEVQRSNNPLYIFHATTEGKYAVTVAMTNSYLTVSKQLTVEVCPPEGRYKRAATASSKSEWNKVYEFLAAPGQFVNEGYMASTAAQAVTCAEALMRKGAHVSLGGFGGYLVLGFDHSIENDGGYNFQIIGNSFEGSSEPGVVYVMQDENGDNLPNDTWYELKGSEYGKAETIQDYEITYYRPSSARMPVAWSDNQGKTGSVDYLAAYHTQDYYYPLWVTATSYTLRGTCLKSRTNEVTSGYWSNDAFEWGYADNFSSIDRLTNTDNHDAGVNANHFRISDAVTFDGKPANLQYIDFVKVQTCVNAKAGWLGEVSVEVFGARDFNLIKNK